MARMLEAGAAAGEAELAVVMMHGRGRTPEEMVALAGAFDLDERVRYLCPEAEGGSWYPESFLAPLAANQPALGRALSLLGGLIDDLRDGFGERRIALCGFSQGACVVAQTLVRRPLSYAGAIIFTGGLIGPPGTVWRVPGHLRGVPVLLTGSEADQRVPSGRTRETHAVLTGLGAAMETVIYEDRDHSVSQDEVARARALLLAAMASNDALPIGSDRVM